MLPYNFTVKCLNDTVDFSDYVTAIDDITIFERNRDYTPIVPTLNFELSKNVDNTFIVPNEPDLNYDIHVSSSFGTVFTGYIDEIEYIYSDRIYDVTCKSYLAKLQEHVIKYDDSGNSLLNVLITSASSAWQYDDDDNWYEDYAGIPTENFQVLYVMEQMFKMAGLNLNVNEVSGSTVGSAQGMTMRRVAIDKHMLFAINLDNAYPYWYHYESQAQVDKYINFWDFVSMICGAFGMIIVPTGIKTFKLVTHRDTSIPNVSTFITDDTTYDKSSKSEYASYDEQQYGFKWAPRIWYYTEHSSYNDLNYPAPNVAKSWVNIFPEEAVKREKGLIKWYNNLRFLLRSNDTNGDILNTNYIFDIQYDGDGNTNASSPIYYIPLANSLTYDYADTEYTTLIQTASVAKYTNTIPDWTDLIQYNKINLEEATTKILQSNKYLTA